MEQNKNMNTITTVLIAIIAVLVTLCILLATGTISLQSNNTNNEQNNSNNSQENQNQQAENNTNNNNSNNNATHNGGNDNTIQYRQISNLNCSNSELTYNDINVKINQKSEDLMCSLNSVTVNGQDIKSNLLHSVDSYAVYDNNVLFLTGDSSGTKFIIYNPASNSVTMALYPNTLNGYWVKSFTTDNSKITITGEECGPQCGYESTNEPYATYEITYSNHTFSSPKFIKKFS